MTDIKKHLNERVLVIDGAMGTMIQEADLSAEDFGGPELDGCNENLVLTRPDVIQRIHEEYLAAGADIIETNTFGSAPLVLAEYDLQDKAREINHKAVELALAAKAKYTTPERPRYVAGAMGPTTKALTVTGGTTFDELVETYTEQATGLLEGGVDLLLLETSQDALNVKAAAIGIRNAEEVTGTKVPVLISCTIEPMGTMLAGQGVEAFYTAIRHFDPVAVGLNCATGPEFMKDHLRALQELAECAVFVYPNAGLPDEDGNYDETPESLASKVEGFVDNGWVNIVGGCCGTTPAHISALAEMAKDKTPRQHRGEPRRAVSQIEYLEVDTDNRPVLVGERTNVIGSRKFKRLIAEEDWETASEVGRAQVKAGAQVVDVCLADPDRDELSDAANLLPQLTRKVKVPIMIDSTDADVIELMLKNVQGKAIINSINLEDGEERFEKVCPIIRKYGAAVIVGTIDEDPDQGMAVTRERKLEIAERSYKLLTEKYHIPAEDIIFDPLVFPCATGDENYVGSAEETIEGVRLITERFPECSTALGVSNVSFGLPPAGREVLNSVYLYRCVQAGLTYAIVNTQVLERYASIPDEEKELADNLLFNKGEDPIAKFAAHFRGVKKEDKKDPKKDMSLEERLAHYIVEGTKDGLFEDLDEALKKDAPLDIINGPLMTGMEKVGKLFNDNELIVAEVLESAEAMKAGVAHLEQFMEAKDDGGKGKILLATVKGDVHDIGKNLVDIILSNNGYKVVNLGIKIPPEKLIEATREHQPDAIGLSGLLVKSAQQMVITAHDLREAGVRAPILVGGAALSQKFTSTRIQPEYGETVLYAKDAMNGLDLANKLLGSDESKAQLIEDQAAVTERMEKAGKANQARQEKEKAAAEHVPVKPVEAPAPKDWNRHVLRNVELTQIWPYINPRMLLNKHLGLRGDPDKLIREGDEKAVKLNDTVEDLKKEILNKGLLEANGVYRYFPAQSDGDAIIVYDPDAPGERVLQRFEFQRQEKTPKRCLSDYVASVESGKMDNVGFFVVTAGKGVRELAEKWKDDGEYLKSHAVQALALETAEAFAERLHQRMRSQWGIPDSPNATMKDLFKAKYTGCRYSFGYPACPELSDQTKLFELLNPEELGVELTDEFMMDPEASVSALVLHHPEAEYFNV